MKYYGLIIPRSYNDYFSRSDPQALKDVVAMSTDAQLDIESAAPIQNKAVAKLIPATASEENQLADKNFVNSTVGTNTANYIYKTDTSGDNVPFESIEELEAYSGTVTNNDYAFVTGIDENGNKYFDRYKANVNGDAVTWAKEYRLNNSSFTAEQWASIESGITSELVAKIGDAGIVPITTADYNELSEEEKMSGKLYLLTDAQNGFITITDEVEASNMSAVTSNAVNGALTELISIKDFTTSNENGYHIVSIIFDKVYTKPPVISFSLIDFVPSTEVDYNYWSGIISVPKIFNVDKNGFKFAYSIRDNHSFTFRFSIIGV